MERTRRELPVAALTGTTRRTKAQMAVLRQRCVTFLREQHPASCRNLYYRLLQDGLVEKSERAYKTLIKLLTAMRRSGEIPYAWLADATRQGHHVYTWRDPESWQRDESGYFRWDMWAPVDHRVEVWCESASLINVLWPVCHELAVSLDPCRGFSSIGFAYGAATEAKRLNPSELVILYIGDHDFDGRNIDRALLRELRLHVADQFPIIERRIAVNADQVAEFELPTRPDRKGTPSVQAEALPPVIMRRLLRDAILEYLPAGQLDKAERETEAGIARLRGAFIPHGEQSS